MIKKKLISVRIDETLIEELDNISKRSLFYSRSNLVESSVKFFIEACKQGLLKDVWYFCPRYGDKCDVLEFRYHREKR